MRPSLSLAAVLAIAALPAHAHDATRGALQHDPGLAGYGYNVQGQRPSGSGQGSRTQFARPGPGVFRDSSAFVRNSPSRCAPLSGGEKICYQAYLDPSLSAQKVEIYFQNRQNRRHGQAFHYENGIFVENVAYVDGNEWWTGGKRYSRLNAHTYAVEEYGRYGRRVPNSRAEVPAEQMLRELGLKSVRLKDAVPPEFYEEIMQRAEAARRNR
ncbi:MULTISPECIES: hypothetical protein [Eikenella]|uniref:Uncharacterized protein n=1 Tax=Eikenella longinqua TaxID=1795827 RepID=A0A1A9RVB2_9NEIS|nr:MULTISPECIES: hypothetical protein [Eikenella]OAM26374.1 hypothetical protein A7P95_09315 [Eikenella longinqua]